MEKRKEFPRRATEADLADTKNCDLCASLLCPCFNKYGDTIFKLIEGNCKGYCLARKIHIVSKEDYEEN